MIVNNRENISSSRAKKIRHKLPLRTQPALTHLVAPLLVAPMILRGFARVLAVEVATVGVVLRSEAPVDQGMEDRARS